MTREAYKDTWGDDPASWPKEIHQYEFDWLTPDVVYVAEYYRVEEVSETIRIFQSIDGSEDRYTPDELTEEVLMQLEAVGSVEVRQKKIKRRRVRMYIMSGSKILDDCGYIAGKCIPIIPMYGKRWFIDNVERCMGHVRMAKDAQRLANMQRSKLAEISALSSTEKPIMTPEQVAGHQDLWARDNLMNYPYMLINPVTGADGSQAPSGPVGYTKPPAVPPAMAALLAVTEQDIRDVLGNQEQGDKIVSNISGKAVEMVQQRLDMQTFIYMSNMAKAIRRCGEVWLSMAKDVYVEPKRKMKMISAQNDMSSVELLRPTVDEDTGDIKMENDLSDANLDVTVDVGPSFTSQRAAIVRSLTGMMAITQDPQAQQVLQSVAIMNMEGEGLSDIRNFFRKKMVEAGVVQPTEEEMMQMQAAMANQKPDPNAIFLQAAAEEATAKAAGARAGVVKTVAEAELARAKTAKTISEIDNDDQKLAIDSMKSIQEMLRG
jgi:hypothetical protein